MAGIAILRGRDLLTFDKGRGIYFRGGRQTRAVRPHRQKQGPLSDIHAIQVLRETVTPAKSGAFFSYEVNLVFADGERVNVMDHGDGAAIGDSARVLAAFLGVPVWQAVY